jgi:hypothetical protein
MCCRGPDGHCLSLSVPTNHWVRSWICFMLVWTSGKQNNSSSSRESNSDYPSLEYPCFCVKYISKTMMACIIIWQVVRCTVLADSAFDYNVMFELASGWSRFIRWNIFAILFGTMDKLLFYIYFNCAAKSIAMWKVDCRVAFTCQFIHDTDINIVKRNQLDDETVQ